MLDANPWLALPNRVDHGATLGGQPSTCPATLQLYVPAVGYVDALWERRLVSQRLNIRFEGTGLRGARQQTLNRALRIAVGRNRIQRRGPLWAHRQSLALSGRYLALRNPLTP